MKLIERKPVGLRIDNDLYLQIKHRAIDEKLSIGALVEKVMGAYLTESKDKNRRPGNEFSRP